jgi:hypothetical protein
MSVVDLLNTDISQTIVFKDVQERTTKGAKPIKYHTIPIATTNNNHFMFVLPKLWSFGVNEDTDFTGNVTGLSVTVCLSGTNAPTEGNLYVDKFKEIINLAKTYLTSDGVRMKLSRPNLCVDALDGMDKVITTRNEGCTMKLKIKQTSVASSTPATESLKDSHAKAIDAIFYDGNTLEETNPLLYTKKACHILPLVQLESIYVGGHNYTLQFKILECDIFPPKQKEFKRERLLHTARMTTAISS